MQRPVNLLIVKIKVNIIDPGVDPGFFLGGGPPLRNGVTKTDKLHFFRKIPVE